MGFEIGKQIRIFAKERILCKTFLTGFHYKRRIKHFKYTDKTPTQNEEKLENRERA